MREEDWRSDGATEHIWQAGDLLPGGRYRVEREIGTWGIRSLYTITDTMTDHPALLCVLSSAGGGEVAEHVARVASLEHPFLPDIREYILRDDLLILLLHVASGTTLDTYLDSLPGRRVDERTAVTWGVQMAEGLAFLHRQAPPLVVADLAPAALLLTPHGRLKLLGLGPLLGLFTQAGLVGALEQGYAAPEVYGGRVDPLSDIYAAGALLHQALTGSRPEVYAPGSLPAVRALRPRTSLELSEVIAKAVALAPEARWQSAAEFGEALRQVEIVLEQRQVATNAVRGDARSSLDAALAGAMVTQSESEPPQPAHAEPETSVPLEHAPGAAWAAVAHLPEQPTDANEEAGSPVAATAQTPLIPPPNGREESSAKESAPPPAPQPQAPGFTAPPPPPAMSPPPLSSPWRDPSDTLPGAPAPAARAPFGPPPYAQPAPAPAAMRDHAMPQAAPGGSSSNGFFEALGGLFRRGNRPAPSAMRATGTVMLAKHMRPKREYPILLRIIGKPEEEVLAVSFAASTQVAKTSLGRVRGGAHVTVEIAAVPADAFRLPQARLSMRAPKPGAVTEARTTVIALRPSLAGSDRLQFTFRDEQGRALHPEPFTADVTIVEASAPAGVSPSAEMLTLAHAITVLV